MPDPQKPLPSHPPPGILRPLYRENHFPDDRPCQGPKGPKSKIKPLETIKNGQNSANQEKIVSQFPRLLEKGGQKWPPGILLGGVPEGSKIVKIREIREIPKNRKIADFWVSDPILGTSGTPPWPPPVTPSGTPKIRSGALKSGLEPILPGFGQNPRFCRF